MQKNESRQTSVICRQWYHQRFFLSKANHEAAPVSSVEPVFCISESLNDSMVFNQTMGSGAWSSSIMLFGFGYHDGVLKAKHCFL